MLDHPAAMSAPVGADRDLDPVELAVDARRQDHPAGRQSAHRQDRAILGLLDAVAQFLPIRPFRGLFVSQTQTSFQKVCSVCVSIGAGSSAAVSGWGAWSVSTLACVPVHPMTWANSTAIDAQSRCGT